MPFFNREQDLKRLRRVLSGEPNLIYFIFGPINSGKTTLLTKVFEDLPEDYRVFYINFRGVETRRYEDFVRALFTVRYEGIWEKIKTKGDLLASGAEFLEKVAQKFNLTFPIPKELFSLFVAKEKPEIDSFKYLEEVFRILNAKSFKPVFVLDELQMLKEINKNGSVLHDLFNFLVRITKETHLCHCLCATSDCLFIEDIYASARLEGRAEYFLVDDLSQEDALRVYESFGFSNKNLVWEYVGGKIGDMVRLYEKEKIGLSEKEALSQMINEEINRLEWIKWKKLATRKDADNLWMVLKKFKNIWLIKKEELSKEFDLVAFWITENILFYNPLSAQIRPQSKLLWHALKKLFV